MAVIGYVLQKKGITDNAFQKKLSTMLLYVVIPCSMLAAGNSTFNPNMASSLLQAAAIAALYYIIGCSAAYILRRKLPWDQKSKNISFTLITLGNTGFVGIPLLQELYGAEGVLFAVVFNLGFQFVAFTVGTSVMGDKISLRRFFTSIMTLSPLIALIIFVSPFRLPVFMVDSLSQVGGLSAPFSMFITGAALANIPFRQVITNNKSWFINLIKMLLFPAAMAAGLYFAGIGGILAPAMLVLASMPPGTINVIFAEQYDTAIPLATGTVVQGTLLMLALLPAWLLVGGVLFPV